VLLLLEKIQERLADLCGGHHKTPLYKTAEAFFNRN
jgi:hypothetical protein